MLKFFDVLRRNDDDDTDSSADSDVWDVKSIRLSIDDIAAASAEVAEAAAEIKSTTDR